MTLTTSTQHDDTTDDDEELPPLSNTKRSVASNTQSRLFHQLPPGTFDFQTGNIKAPSLKAKEKKTKEKSCTREANVTDKVGKSE